MNKFISTFSETAKRELVEIFIPNDTNEYQDVYVYTKVIKDYVMSWCI